VNVAVTKKAALTIILDPSTGDAIKVQGDAQLNAGVDPVEILFSLVITSSAMDITLCTINF